MNDNKGDEFFDFMIFNELMFPGSLGGFDCPHCGATIDPDAQVEVVDKKSKTFKCPECDEEIEA